MTARLGKFRSLIGDEADPAEGKKVKEREREHFVVKKQKTNYTC